MSAVHHDWRTDLNHVQRMLEQEPRYLSTTDENTLRQFSKLLRVCQVSDPCDKTVHKWYKLCLHLLTDSAPFAKCRLLANKIAKTLPLADRQQASNEATAATELAVLLSDADLMACFDELLSDEAKAYQQQHPADVAAAKTLTQRLVSGSYGPKLKSMMLDSLQNPLLLLPGFLRLLLLDLILQGKDPQKAVRWFSQASEADIAFLKRSLVAIRQKLAAHADLSDVEINSLLLRPKPHLSSAIERAIKMICEAATPTINQTLHSRLLEHIGYYFQPTNEQLAVAVKHCLEGHHSDRAFSLACYTAGKERDKAVLSVLQSLRSQEEDIVTACSLVETLLIREPDYYVQVVSFFTPILIEAQYLSLAIQYAKDIGNHSRFAELVSPITAAIISFVAEPKRGESLVALIECSPSFETRSQVLEQCIDQLLRPREIQNSAPIDVVGCLTFIDMIKDKLLQLQGRSSLLFIALKNSLVSLKYEEREKELLPKYVQMAEKIEDKAIRQDLFERLCCELLKDPISEIDIARIEVLIDLCKEGQDKALLQKQLALTVDKVNHKKALEIVTKIKDNLVKLQTRRLLGIESDEQTTDTSSSSTLRGVLSFLSKGFFCK